jgi:hypothetical protein
VGVSIGKAPNASSFEPKGSAGLLTRFKAPLTANSALKQLGFPSIVNSESRFVDNRLCVRSGSSQTKRPFGENAVVSQFIPFTESCGGD